MITKWLLVNTSKKMARAVEDIEKSFLLGMDTEYDSFRYFRAKLCLVQINAGDTTYIFDPLGDFDLSFLGKYFAERRKLKILHAADNDIRLLKRDYSFDFVNIFDTHRAALLLGFKELSLEKIIAEFTGIELKKSKKMQRSRWDNRPLSDEQLAYAAQDVAHLSSLYKKQMEKLKKSGLEHVAQEAFARIAAAQWQDKKIDRQGHTKIKGYRDLNQEQKDLLKKLYVWRFRRAEKINRPLFMFLSDRSLVSLAQDKESIEEYLSADKIKLYGEEIRKIVEEHS
ncbi:MAG TPA: ribonuclease D [Deltaproteobacteria bacterium]|nr:ribonuclease D [Deltaproteobacteria bacterium]